MKRSVDRARLGDPVRRPRVLSDLPEVLVETYAVNDRMNQVLLQHLDPRVWRARLPGSRSRTIAAIFSHMHNMRLKWLRLSAPHLRRPPQLSPGCSQEQAAAALAESAARCCEMIAGAITSANPSVTTFHRDGWARPWPAGAAMVVYMISHDAHHRGQVHMLAHQLGFPLPVRAAAGIWSWEKLWKECGFTRPR